MTLIEWLVMAWDAGIIARILMTPSIQLGQESKCHNQFDEWTWIFDKDKGLAFSCSFGHLQKLHYGKWIFFKT